MTVILALAAAPTAPAAAAAQGDPSPAVVDVGPLGAGVASGLYAPGPSPVTVHVTSTAEIAMDAAALVVGARLSTGTLRRADGEALPAAAQTLLRGVLQDGDPTAASALEDALAASGAGEGTARALCEALAGLLTDRAPGQVTEAIRRFNELVRRAGPAFLRAPPPELLGVRAVLAELAAAAAGPP